MNQIEYREIVINPRVIKHLGKDLITTSDVAITELIKNSLDAKADQIRLHIFDDFMQASGDENFIWKLPEDVSVFLAEKIKLMPVFVIEDNGRGMNKEQLDRGFLEVGTDIKLKENNATLGEKGIGRLATQRLGTYLLIETASAEENFATVTFIDWEKIGYFEECRRVPSIKIKKVTDNYTRLWIFNINMQDFIEIPEQLTFEFGQEMKYPVNRDLKSAINFLISPFELSKKNIISMYYGDRVLDVEFNCEMLQFSESRHEFKLLKNEAQEFVLQYSLNIEPWYLERVHRAMVKPEAFKRLKKTHTFYADLLETNRDKIDNVLVKTMSESQLIQIIADVYEQMYENEIKKAEIREEYSDRCARKLLDNLTPILPIKGQIYSFKQNAAIGEHIIIEAVKEIRCPHTEIQLKDLKNFLEENNGIKLYRSRYRIGYLGNKESDWIRLQQFRTKGQQWYRFDLGNTIGFVSLTDEKQEYIREISSRLDIIQNDTSESFKKIVNIVCNKLFYDLNRNANNILKSIFEQNGLFGESLKKQVKKNLNDIANASQKSKTMSDKLQKFINMASEEEKNNKTNKEFAEKMRSIMEEILEHIEEEKKVQNQATVLLNEANEQLKTVEVEAYNNFKLMANGLITETITHELDSVCKTSGVLDITEHFEFMKEYFVGKKEVGIFNKHINPIRRSYDAISNKMTDVGNLYNFLEKTFIKKGTYDEFEYQNISEVVRNIEANLLQLQSEKIGIECLTGNVEWFVPKGVLIHVFYNLFTNATYWIDRRRKYALTDRNFATEEVDKIVVKCINDEEIIVYDTGTGIMKNMEDILFQPLESGKPNREGRGMGLYIVQQLLRSFSADIQLLDERNRYGNRYKFLLSLNTEER